MEFELEVLRVCDRIRQIAFELHAYLKQGHLEKVYENGLVNRLRNSGLHVEQQYPLKVLDEDGTELGNYFADLFVENCLIIELKSCQILSQEHVAQLFGYLRASRQKHGMLINFGGPKIEVRKFVL